MAAPTEGTPPRSFALHDVLGPDDVRAVLQITSDHKWEDVRARIPWSDQLGSRTLRIEYARLLSWLAASERRVA